MIRTNADILMRLVSQMLDFRKFEAGELKLHLQPTNLDEAFGQWCEPFKALARKKIIRYLISGNFGTSEQAMGLIDVDKMESVVYNLLSNAFKFTPEGGRITVQGMLRNETESGRRLVIVIEDSGQGIAPKKSVRYSTAFTRLTLTTRALVSVWPRSRPTSNCTRARLSPESAPGKGSRFTINVPCVERIEDLPSEHLNEVAQVLQPAAETEDTAETSQTATMQPAEKVADGQLPNPNVAGSVPSAKPAGTSANAGNEPKPTVLIIDDNEDIRSYARILLGSEYCVEEAVNGREGLDKARQLMPDAVVCDVMMPVMDGWECCRRLKDEWQTSHIPVMLLTACTLNEQRIMGFDSGADAYIEKPFSPDMFRARLRNLIVNRRRLKAFFGDKSTIEKADVSDLDKGFAERFRELIDLHLNNSDLSVEDLASEMGLGRSQLYRKVKALTGYSPVELIRVARLKKGGRNADAYRQNSVGNCLRSGLQHAKLLDQMFP